MDIARQLMVGESISHAQKDILPFIEQNKLPSFRKWYGITTAYEKDNLFYILSGTEYRHPMYHNRTESLKLIGIAGSRTEAITMIQNFIDECLKENTLMNLKEALRDW